MLFYLRARAGEHPQSDLARWSSLLQAETCDGYNQLYDPESSAGSILGASWQRPQRPENIAPPCRSDRMLTFDLPQGQRYL